MTRTVTKNKGRTMKLAESWNSLQEGRIDLKQGIVRNVKIIGLESTHGYSYSPQALKAAVPLYEGVRVNIDHPTRTDVERRSRSYADRFGRLHNAKFVDGKGIFGDLKYNRQHALAKQFEYDVKHDSKNLGLSQYAHGKTRRQGSKEIVESITAVGSVDLVADPATTQGLFESKRLRQGRGLRVKRQRVPKWQKLMESLGMELGETPTPREAIAKLLESIVLDDTLSPKQRKEKILKALELDVDESSSATRVKESEDTMKPKNPATPSKTERRALREAAKLRTELDKRKKSDRARSLCESMRFSPTPEQLKAVMAMTTKGEAKRLVESFQLKEKKKDRTPSNKPRSRQNEEAGTKRFTEAEIESWLDGVLE